MAVLPRSEVERIIRKAGAERVSLDAPDALCGILEDRAIEIVERALLIAKHARGRIWKRKAKRNAWRRAAGKSSAHGAWRRSPAGLRAKTEAKQEKDLNGKSASHSRKNGRRKTITLKKEDILLAVS